MVKILVVDDSRIQRKRLTATLSNQNYTVIQAVDGYDALAAVEKHHPDVVLTDLLMPNLDGTGLLEQLQNENHTLPVIVVSANFNSQTQAYCIELGAYATLRKPVTPSELLTTITEALEKAA